MLFSPLLLSILEVRGMCCVVFNPPSNGRFRPPLSKKAFPVHRVEKRYASREVGFFCFPKLICSFLDGGVFQFFGNTVICLMCPINRFSDHRWRKESGRNLYLSKNYLGKKFCEKQTNKQKSPPDFIGKKVPVGRSTGNNFFI